MAALASGGVPPLKPPLSLLGPIIIPKLDTIAMSRRHAGQAEQRSKIECRRAEPFWVSSLKKKKGRREKRKKKNIKLSRLT